MKKDSISLSIIISTLNEELFVLQILKDLASQTFKNFEVIIVDRNSSDRTRKVIRDFIIQHEKMKITLFSKDFKKAGKTAGAQRNYGAKRAIAPRLLFLDADNSINKDFLSKNLSEVIANNYDIASAKFSVNPPDYKKRNYSVKTRLDQIFVIMYNTGISLLHQTTGTNIFVSKELHNSLNGFDEQSSYGEDIDYFQRAKQRSAKFGVLSGSRLIYNPRRLNLEGRLVAFTKTISLIFLANFSKIFSVNTYLKYLPYRLGGKQYSSIKMNRV